MSSSIPASLASATISATSTAANGDKLLCLDAQLAKAVEAFPPVNVSNSAGSCSNPGDCGRAYQACCAGFATKGFPCGCHLQDGGSGSEGGNCGDCGSAYQLCCAGFKAKGFPCTCDVLPSTINV
jgi:sialate O-acetylesterase